MFRIVCDPSSGSMELYLTEIIRSGSQMFVVCLFSVWQRNFHSNMFRIVCDPSSGSMELYLTEIIRSGSQMFVACLVGVWQSNL